MEEFDYGIIGGGPAGYTAAMLYAKNNKKVVLFEKDKLGGTCLNKGCIPTKALVHYSEIYKTLNNLSDCGINVSGISLDFEKIQLQKSKIVEKVRKSLELAVKNSAVMTVYEEAQIVNKNLISAGGIEYHVKNIIKATGSKPRELKGLEFDHEFVLSSDDVLELKELPTSVLIVGSGAIGIEWARIFSNFGVEVTVVEKAEHLLPVADIEVSKRIERIFKQNKIKYYLQESISKIEEKTVVLENGTCINPDFILSAAGRTIADNNDTDCVTIGDAAGEILLAHYAIHQATEMCLNIPFERELTPSVIYGTPEIAWVGKREQDCADDCNIHSLPITALGKSWCDESIDGFIKIITKGDDILGAHIVSKEASSLIHTVLLAIQNNIGFSEFKKICFAHPTYAEGFFELAIRN